MRARLRLVAGRARHGLVFWCLLHVLGSSGVTIVAGGGKGGCVHLWYEDVGKLGRVVLAFDEVSSVSFMLDL